MKKKSNIVYFEKETLKDNPNIGSIVIEYMIIQPYSKVTHEAMGLPFYDITTLTKLVYAAINPPEYLVA